MDRYLIIADDFTGANDTGVQLRRRGLATSVIFSGKKLPVGTGCLVVDTESRGTTAETASASVSAACDRSSASGSVENLRAHRFCFSVSK